MPEVLETVVARPRRTGKPITSQTRVVGIEDARTQDSVEEGGLCSSMSRHHIRCLRFLGLPSQQNTRDGTNQDCGKDHPVQANTSRRAASQS